MNKNFSARSKMPANIDAQSLFNSATKVATRKIRVKTRTAFEEILLLSSYSIAGLLFFRRVVVIAVSWQQENALSRNLAVVAARTHNCVFCSLVLQIQEWRAQSLTSRTIIRPLRFPVF